VYEHSSFEPETIASGDLAAVPYRPASTNLKGRPSATHHPSYEDVTPMVTLRPLPRASRSQASARAVHFQCGVKQK
jgi:hypothetical protein